MSKGKLSTQEPVNLGPTKQQFIKIIGNLGKGGKGVHGTVIRRLRVTKEIK
ncbi:MAG: hypothetical protein ACI9H6_000269 [Patiriisocius sp.]|jgi:hypothetical protein